MRVGVIGKSGCGKSRLVRDVILPAWVRRGYSVAVLDPLCQPWPGANWQTNDPARFLAMAKASEQCVLVVDEAQDTMRGTPQRERDMAWLSLQSRNRGHVVYFLGQRALQLPPNVRNQLTHAYAFHQTTKDAEDLGSLLMVEGLDAILPRLSLGVCYEIGMSERPRLLRVF